MFGLLIVSAIIGLFVGSFTGLSLLGWTVGGAILLLGLPWALISSFIHREVSYTQDRADYRQYMSDLSADRRAEDNPVQVHNDNRQIHFNGGGT